MSNLRADVIGVEERLLCLLGVVFQRADDLQDTPDVASLPVRLAELVEFIELGIVVTFQALRFMISGVA